MFSWIGTIIQNNPIVTTVVLMLFVSSAVGAMPSPTFTSTSGYRWLFDFLHIFTGGLFRIIATRNPSFQAGYGAQPFRPENANGLTAQQIKKILTVINEVKDKPSDLPKKIDEIKKEL